MTVRSRAGFTLMETIVALLVLTAGLLALARTAPASLRLAAAGAARGEGAVLARSRIEAIRADPCGAVAGQEVTDRFVIAWSVPAVGGALVTVTVSPRHRGGPPGDTMVAIIPCAG